MFFTLTTFLHIFSILISAVVLGLAQVNFGLLLIWTNSIVGALGLVYHIMILFLHEFRRPTTSRPKIPWKRRYFILKASMKMPKTPLPSYHRHHRSSSSSQEWNDAALIAASTNKSGGGSHKFVPSGPFYSTASLFSIVILAVLTIIGFGMTVEVAMHGTSSMIPSDREKEVSFPLGLKAEKAQCAFLGVQTLLSLALFVLCIRGRSRISKAEEETRDEAEGWYGSGVSTRKVSRLSLCRSQLSCVSLASPLSCHFRGGRKGLCNVF